MSKSLLQLAELAQQGYTLVTPNIRLASYLDQQLIEQLTHLGIWQAPKIQSYEKFISTCYHERVFGGALGLKKQLDTATEQWLWEQAIERAGQAVEYREDTENPTDSLLSTRGAAAEAMRAYRLLLSWLINTKEHAFALQSYLDSRCFLNWAAQFEALADQLGVVTFTQLQRAILDGEFAHSYLHYESASQHETENIKLAIVGFQMLEPLQKRCIHRLASHVVEVDLKHGAKSKRLESRHFVYPCETREQEWTRAAQWLLSQHKLDSQGRYAVVIPSLAQNRISIDRIFKQTFTVGLDAFESGGTAVNGATVNDAVANGADVSITDINSIENSAYNMSSGSALASRPLVQHWLWLLQALISDLGIDETLSLIWSPFLFPEQDYAVRNRLSKSLFESGESRFALREWSKLLSWSNKNPANKNKDSADKSKFESLLLGVNRLLSDAAEIGEPSSSKFLKRKTSIDIWIASFKSVTKHFSWASHRTLNSDEFQQLEMFENVLSEICDKNKIFSDLTARQAIRIIQHSLQATLYQAQTRRDESVCLPEVLGVLEASGQHYDGIWLCEMSDVDWPNTVKTNGFLPYSLQLALEMPGSPLREKSYASIQTKQLMSASSQLVVSYCQEIDESETRLSAYVQQFLVQAEVLPVDTLKQNIGQNPRQKLTENYGATVSEIADESSLEKIEDEFGLSLPDQVMVRAKASANRKIDELEHEPDVKADDKIKIRGGSDMLAMQAKLPLLAYLRYRLEIRALPTQQSGLTAAERGICLHRILENLWSELDTQGALKNIDELGLRQLLEKNIEEVLIQVLKRRFKVLHPVEIEIEKRSLSDTLEAWLEVEKKRMPFAVVAREQAFEYEYKNYSIAGRIDRVDQIENLGLSIIDYKSGASSVVGWFDEECSNPQMPFYAIALSSHNESSANAITYANLKIGEIGLKGVANCLSDDSIDKGIIPLEKIKELDTGDWSTLLGRWQDKIHSHIESVISGDASMDVDTDLQEDHYQPLLRSGFYSQAASYMNEDGDE